MRKLALLPIIAALVCPVALAQQPSFEVATVKRSPPAEGGFGIRSASRAKEPFVSRSGARQERSEDARGAPATAAAQSAGHIASNQMSMQTLSLLLSRAEHQMIPDMTGLKGAYEVTLEWSLQNGSEPASGPSLFTAVQEQPGLRLEARKGPVDVLVVDGAEKVPADNQGFLRSWVVNQETGDKIAGATDWD